MDIETSNKLQAMVEENREKFKVYSCRFEFSHDYTTFLVEAAKHDVVISTHEFHLLRLEDGGAGPDAYVEFSTTADLETVRDFLRNGPDLHVGLQTLKPTPMKDNVMKRDFSIK